jgi:predicted fused transcriptional regulator/phosphomethylpyrimidine kinase/hydrogenase maturation factor
LGSDETHNEPLGLGKVSAEVLKRSVLSLMPIEHPSTLDTGDVPLSGKAVVAHSPSIGVPLETLGFFAFHYAASNVASRLAKPRYLINGIYLPLKTKEGDLRTIAKGLGEEAKKYGVTVVTGQTATYFGLEIPLVTTTCLGETLRSPKKPEPEDHLILVGAVGGEAVWLKSLSEGVVGDEWRSFTPLPAALALLVIQGVRLMHDVSEGGVKKALQEVADAFDVRIDIESDRIVYAQGTDHIDQDLLRAPTYGTLIVIVSPDALEETTGALEGLSIVYSDVGVINEGEGVYIDGNEVDTSGRIALDEIYGALKEHDEVLKALRDSADKLVGVQEFSQLIPQVGTNIVYAKEGASSFMDVAAIGGRIISCMGKPKLCGEAVYGGSRFIASAVLEAMKIDPTIRAAVNIKGDKDIAQILTKKGLYVCVLQSGSTEDACPVTTAIQGSGKVHRVYYHPGAFGVEPSITLLGESPEQLATPLIELVENV